MAESGSKADKAGHEPASTLGSVPGDRTDAAGSAAVPPQIPYQQTVQALQSAFALGFNFPPAQQNPETVHHITAFLTQDANNRLQAVTEAGRRNHVFRMAALGIGTSLVVLVVVILLFVQLYRGDIRFVDKVPEAYLPVIGAVLLAPPTRPKLSEIFKG